MTKYPLKRRLLIVKDIEIPAGLTIQHFNWQGTLHNKQLQPKKILQVYVALLIAPAWGLALGQGFYCPSGGRKKDS